jgi:hypothetical protein
MLIASQLFWIRRVGELGKRLIPSKRWRKGLGAAGLMVYLFLLAFNLLSIASHVRSVGLSRSS